MKITFIGGGNMANALIGGLVGTGFAAADVCAVDISADCRARLEQSFAIRTAGSIDADVAAADVIVLAVKPQQMRAVCAELAPFLDRQLVLSIAAGLRSEDLSRWLGGHSRLVRAMPNTPALIGAGVTGLCAAPGVAQDERDAADRIMRAVGETLWVAEEAQIDAVTAVSGSGPAYLFLLVEAMQQAARELGFDDAAARRLSLGTVLGAAQLAAQSPESAAVLRERVTSKGGTTAAALATMAERGVKEGIVAGVHAAEQRSRELGVELGAAGAGSR